MSKISLSRRGLITAAIAIPVVTSVGQAKASAKPVIAGPDPVIARAEEWVANNERVDALSVEADDLQGKVFDKARALGIKGDKACRSRMPEARAWRAKKQDLEKACRSLATLTGDIRKMRAITVAGAIAKIELSLHVQCEEWSEHAFELVEEGIAELRQLTALQVQVQ
ncbi:MAG: hypothetical protein EON93_11310 [Burkholderiales bacterium]|nr:MAG: hypothetical protein EON93_11310 [Burkholderiales bacterium]